MQICLMHTVGMAHVILCVLIVMSRLKLIYELHLSLLKTAQMISKITTNVRIGFGSFNDKPVFPFSQLTPTGCGPGTSVAGCAA